MSSAVSWLKVLDVSQGVLLSSSDAADRLGSLDGPCIICQSHNKQPPALLERRPHNFNHKTGIDFQIQRFHRYIPSHQEQITVFRSNFIRSCYFLAKELKTCGTMKVGFCFRCSLRLALTQSFNAWPSGNGDMREKFVVIHHADNTHEETDCPQKLSLCFN